MSAVDVEQLVDQPGGFDLVELADALAEALDGEVFDVGLIEVVLGDELLNQFALLGGAIPRDVCRRLAGADPWLGAP